MPHRDARPTLSILTTRGEEINNQDMDRKAQEFAEKFWVAIGAPRNTPLLSTANSPWPS